MKMRPKHHHQPQNQNEFANEKMPPRKWQILMEDERERKQYYKYKQKKAKREAEEEDENEYEVDMEAANGRGRQRPQYNHNSTSANRNAGGNDASTSSANFFFNSMKFNPNLLFVFGQKNPDFNKMIPIFIFLPFQFRSLTTANRILFSLCFLEMLKIKNKFLFFIYFMGLSSIAVEIRMSPLIICLFSLPFILNNMP
jgi:hypothetical protein